MSYGIGGSGSVPEAGTFVAPVAGTRLYLRRTATQGKKPAAGDAEYGELFVNYHSGSPMLCFKDNAGEIVEIKPTRNIDGGGGETPPSTGNEIGDTLWDGTHFRVWDGTTWVAVGPNDLAYVQKVDGGTITNSAGSDVDIPVVNNIQAGLMLPADKNKLDTYPADAADLEVDLGYTAAADKGTVTNTAGDDAEIPLATGTNAGLMAPGDKNKLDGYPATPGDLAATLDLQAVTDNGNTTTNGAEFGGGNIELNADGSASFSPGDGTFSIQANADTKIFSDLAAGSYCLRLASGIDSTNTQTNAETPKIDFLVDGIIRMGTDTTSAATTNITLNGVDGSALFSAGNISLNADGSGVFGAGSITADGDASFRGGDFSGRLTIQRDDDNSAAVLLKNAAGVNTHIWYGNGVASFATNNVVFQANGDASFEGEVTATTYKYTGSAPSPALAGKEIDLVATLHLMAVKLAELGGVDVASLFVANDPAPVTQPAEPADDEGASSESSY